MKDNSLSLLAAVSWLSLCDSFIALSIVANRFGIRGRRYSAVAALTRAVRSLIQTNTFIIVVAVGGSDPS